MVYGKITDTFRSLNLSLCEFLFTNIILGHDTVQHVLGAIGGGHSDLIELDQIVLDELKARGLEEDGAAVHVLLVVLGHGLGARLGREDAVVVELLELGQEVLMKLLGLELLQTNDVRIQGLDVLENELLAVVPGQGPRRTVAVVLPRGVLVAQDVVAHGGEYARVLVLRVRLG
jgi:hypothetical protein